MEQAQDYIAMSRSLAGEESLQPLYSCFDSDEGACDAATVLISKSVVHAYFFVDECRVQ
jgi:hypothetical protein